ncbi:MAG: penicillin-binding protein activator LpoB [Leptospirales bacterium]|nr:penicillin-binding protein activator LpoB [Leptospirales bacterium]
MFNKITIILLIITTVFIANTAFSQVLTIDNAVSEISKELSKNIPKGNKVAVVNISSDHAKLSNYVIDELTANLVNIGSFNVIPRNKVELEMATRELTFQMTGLVSQDTAKSLGNFLGADIIVMGTIVKDSQNSFRLSVDAIVLENFVYAASSRKRFNDDERIRMLTGSKDVYIRDYTTGERFGMAALNVFFGIGSIYNGHHIGWVTTGLETIGIASFLVGYSGYKGYKHHENKTWATPLMSAGVYAAGAGIVFGFIIPFFHHKPGSTSVSVNDDFPINFEFVSFDVDNKDIDGFRIGYTVRF